MVEFWTSGKLPLVTGVNEFALPKCVVFPNITRLYCRSRVRTIDPGKSIDEVSFRKVEDDVFRAKYNKLPTSFHLTEEQMSLIVVVPSLIDEDLDMIRLNNALTH